MACSSAMEPKDIVYAIGILATFILGVWNLVANFRASRTTSFINTVTSQRIKWIEQLRQDIAAYCGLTYTWCFSEIEGKPQEFEVLKEIDRLRHVIRLRLNPDGTFDRKIQALVNRIPELTDSSKREELKKALGELVEISQVLVKEEWEKVKAESEHGNLKK
jgi:hypothetical protein